MSDTACVKWPEVEPGLRERAYNTLDNDPQILLEGPGGTAHMTANLIYARLLGLDDEIVADGVRLQRAEPVHLVPLWFRPSPLAADDCVKPVLRTATYRLQSGFVLWHMAAEYAPPGVTVGDDFRFTVLYVRYRRDLQ